MSEMLDRGFLRSLRLDDTMYMLVAGSSGLSDELDTEGGLVRVRLIVFSRFMYGNIVGSESAGGFTGYDLFYAGRELWLCLSRNKVRYIGQIWYC
jgi:hypothetical protein